MAMKAGRADIGLRQQHPQHGGRGGDVDHRAAELHQHDARRRQRDGEAAPADAARAEGRPAKKRCEGQQDRAADRGEDRRRQADGRGDIDRIEDEAERRDAGKAEPEGDGDEGDDARDIGRLEAEAAIEAEADRAAGERPEAGGVADRIGAEGGQRDQMIGDAAAEMGERRPVIDAERQERERRQPSAAAMAVIGVACSASMTSS